MTAVAGHATELTVVSPDSVFQINDTAYVSVTVGDIAGLFGAGFDLDYDPVKATYLKAIEGPFLSSNNEKPTIFIVTDNDDDGTIIAGITRSHYSDGGASSAGDTTLLTLVFQVNTPDSIPLTITHSSLIAPDGVTKYPHTVINGFIMGKNSTDVEEYESDLPIGIAINISKCYPNPFNSKMCIELDISQNAFVDVEIVNILGQAVRNLHSGPMRKAKHFLSWDGHDDNGHQSASGIYYIVAQTGKAVKTKKVVYLK